MTGKKLWILLIKLLNVQFFVHPNIAYYIVIGEDTEEKALSVKECHIKLSNMIEGKLKLIVDLTHGGKSSPEARKIFKELSELERTGKIALIGIHPVARVIASFVMGISKNKDMRFFKTKEEALAWLKE